MDNGLIQFILITILNSNFVKAPCENLIYCQGDLLHVVQLSKIFSDSKTFVDMNMVNTPEETLREFDQLMRVTQNKPTKTQVNNFVSKFFQNTDELKTWTPSDFNPNPRFLRKIKTIKIRNFAHNLINVWPILGRKVRNTVFRNPSQFSIIPVTNGFISPGGRFREYYYWDSLWICKGLIISEMIQTAKGMLDNFISIIQRYGFVPNGGRIYYLDRSQPPVVTMMAADYMEATNDYYWLKNNVEYLEKELKFWLDERTVDLVINGQQYTLAHFSSLSDKPRPESYVEDLHSASIFTSMEGKRKHYTEIRSGAESGWDFSSRWLFDSGGGNKANLSSIEARRIIPVDLNSFLCKSFQILGKFYETLKNYQRAEYWKEKYLLWQKNIELVLYDAEDGIWYDFDSKLLRKRKYFYPSNFAPLWAECVNVTEKMSYGRNATEYLLKQDIMDFEGGIPSSLLDTREQWDLPNAWAPSQGIIIFGLEKSGEAQAKEIAREFAERWISSNKHCFLNTKQMFEKYNAINPGVYGGGGEYIVQSGFGWSNAVILELIDYYYVKNKILN